MHFPLDKAGIDYKLNRYKHFTHAGICKIDPAFWEYYDRQNAKKARNFWATGKFQARIINTVNRGAW